MKTNPLTGQKAVAASQNIKEKNYWLKQLSEFSNDLTKNHFPYDFKYIPTKNRTTHMDSFTFKFPGQLSQKLTRISSGMDHMLHMVLVAAMVLLLKKYTGGSSENFIVASPIYKENTHNHTGFINTVLPLRQRINPGITFRELLKQVKQTLTEAVANQNYPVEILTEQLNLPFSPDDDFPLADIFILLENIHDRKYIHHIRDKMIFSFSRKAGIIDGVVEYSSSRWRGSTIERITEHFKILLQKVLFNVDLKFPGIDILSTEEKNRLLFAFNNTEADYPGDRTIHRLFEEQAVKTPDNIAVIAGPHFVGTRFITSEIATIAITYNELNQNANQLTHLLRKKGVQPDAIVGLMLEPSIEMIAAMLAILKAGGSYLPIDTLYPAKRIDSILEDSRAPGLITKEELIKDLSFMSLQSFEKSPSGFFVSLRRLQVEDLDSLQIPDRSLIDYEKYSPYIGQSTAKNSITLQFTRGCVFNCAFCFKVWPDKYVVRSAENIFREMQIYYKMGIRRFAFVDDLPNLNVKESSKLFNLIIKSGMKVHLHFPNGIRGDILTKKYIDLMVEAGTVTMDLALETTSPRLQKLVRKNLNLKKLEENIKYIAERYPHVILETQILHGIPSETREEARASLDFIKRIQWIHFPYIHILNIYPQSDMAEIAVRNGISREAIERSADLAYHELPGTLPFPGSFTRQYQSEFLNEYFLSPERLLDVLPYQMKVLTEDELVQKYNSYLPMEITGFSQFLDYIGIDRNRLDAEFLPDDYGVVPDFNGKLATYFAPLKKKPGAHAMRILLLDLTQYFTHDNKIMYDVVEPPLGLMYLLTHLNKTFGSRINGKIAKSRIDFDSFDELKSLVNGFQPDVIGIRALNFYKDFFHKTTALLRQWGTEAPIIAGGPYATSNYPTMLQDKHIDLAVPGEGEISFSEVIEKILDNNKKLPHEDILKKIPGIAFIEKKEKPLQKRYNREVFLVDKLQDRLSLEPVQNPEPVNTPDDLAYIIYTSGSTGIPKGVMVRHNNLVNQVSGLEKTFDLDGAYHYILLAAFTFDVSMMHIFLPLTTGAKLFLIPGETRKDPTKLWQFIYENRIDILNIVPAFMKAILENIEKKKFHFKYLFVGGDIFDIELYTALKETFNTERIINIYGPTETTINATLYPCLDRELENRQTIPIGKPLTNYKVYILDDVLNPVPIGAAGELYISGAGVARGYLNRPELTAEKFLPAFYRSYRSYISKRIYKTGDLARWLLDGNIEFLGRIDQQVKIRGFRIEPGEIEKRLLDHGGVTEVVVIAKEDKAGGKCLCAYIVLAREIEVSVPRDYLANQLPGYMVPAYFVPIEKIPLTPGGKVDKQALPKHETRAKGMYAPPGDEVQKALVELWAEVLGIEKEAIGIDDNFFEMGGHSLKATILISKIHKKLEVRIPLVELFRTPNVRGLSGYIKGAAADKYSAVQVTEEKEYYALSSAQKRLYILQQMDLDSIAYNMPAAMTLAGEIKKEKFEKTFLELIKRHKSFRTSFHMVENLPVQKVHDKVEFEIEYDGMKEVEVKVKVEEEAALISSFIRPFDLSRAPLLRVGLIKKTGISYLLLVDMHHIISDGISISILINDFMALYQGKPLPGLRIQYKDYSEWQKSAKQEETIKKQKDFWLNQFNNEIPVLNLPVDYARPAVQSFAGSTVNFKIGAEETERLKTLALEGEASLFMVLLSIYYILLWELSGQEDIVIGTPTAGRQHADFQQVIGMFVNTLALHNQLNRRHTFKELLHSIKGNTLKAFDNQAYQFEDLVEKLDVNRNAGRNPLFDVMFTFQNVDIPEVEIPGLTLAPYEFENPISKFDMSLSAVEVERHLLFTLEYCTGLFKEGTLQRFTGYFKNILAQVLKNPAQRIADIDFIPKEEKSQILFDFNDTAAAYPKNKTIHQLLAEQVELTPDNIAVVGPSQIKNRTYMTYTTYITYRELNEKSNQLAHLLIEKGVLPDTIVGIMEERSLEMIIGILGILKSGGAYLTIDPQYPEDRIKYMLKDSSEKILLAAPDLTSAFEPSLSTLTLTSTCQVSPTNLAYVLYTSGTTGRPKSVMVEHRSVIRLVKNTNYVKFENRDRLLQTCALTFDVSTFEIWGALLNGLTLFLVSKETILESKQLKKAIEKYEITIMWLTSPLFNQVLDSDIEVFAGLHQLLVGGDVVSSLHINRLKSGFPGLSVINGYGPTENTTFSTTYLIDREYKGDIPIGKPISNSTAYIVAKTNHLVPPGVVGELVVGGDGVARGYLNQPELTAEKFIFATKTQRHKEVYFSLCLGALVAKLYKTGDLARWLPDGNIEFLGRIDHQVKIRGFRIELGEIETQLLTHKKIKDAVVVIKNKNTTLHAIENKYLCAYIVPNKKLKITGLREHLSHTLPDYMIPSYFVFLDTIPLTPSGKIDRKTLPEPGIKAGDAYLAPRDKIEEKLVEIWREVLGINGISLKIGIHDNFFELGGHSLKATILVSKIHKKLNVKIPLSQIFKTPGIKGLAEYIKAAAKEKYEPIAPAEKKEFYALSSAQNRMYVLQQVESTGTVYNMPFIMCLEGEIDRDKFEKAFLKLIKRHESLGTSFHMIENQPVQKVHEKNYKLQISNFKQIPNSKSQITNIIKNFVQPFDLSRAPLLRVGLIKKTGHSYLLLVDMHHIIGDGISIRLLLKDFMAFYQGKTLPELRVQYKDYQKWQNNTQNRESRKLQETYWLNQLDQEIPELNLPVDYTRPEVQSFEGDNIGFHLDRKETRLLKACARQEGVTLFIILLALYNILLAKLSGQEDIVIGIPSAGRRHADLGKIIGMFVNTLALRNFPAGEKTFKSFLGEVKEQALKAFENQDYPFEDLVEIVEASRNPSRNPLFDTMIVLQNMNPEFESTPKIEIQTGKGSLKLLPYKYENILQVSKFDLTWQCEEKEEQLFFSCEYCTKLFKQETIKRFIKYFKKIISSILENPGTKISGIEIIPGEEKRRILFDFNETATRYPEEKTIHQLFAEQAERTPGNIAVIGGEVGVGTRFIASVSFKELNRNSNQLACLLKQKGIQPDTIVGIMIERSIQMIVGILGILKAGGAYLPIDPDYPGERIDYMIKDSNVRVLATTPKLQVKVKVKEKTRQPRQLPLQLINIESEFAPVFEPSHSNLTLTSTCQVSPTNLAYVIYTSGTTGKPKGILTTHANVIRVVKNTNYIDITPDDRILQLSNYAFDGSVFDIYGALLNGAVLVMIKKQDVLSPAHLSQYIKQEAITVFFVTTALFNILIDIDIQCLSQIRKVLFGGEKISVEHSLKALKYLGKNKIIHVYGPTETTVYATYYHINSIDEKKETIPIGQPLSNTVLYIMGKSGEFMPIGVPGQLFIGGTGAARGYLNQPELTAEKFLPVFYRSYRSYRSYISKKTYKTGDLARWLPDGNVEFLGRIDQQVKIRGFRIEPGEIENHLQKHRAIKEAVVVTKETRQDKNLWAYITVDNETILTAYELEDYLAGKLPAYMVPSYFVQVEKIPLTSSGKIDRGALLALDGISLDSGFEYTAPGNAIEGKLVETWEKVLQREKIGIHENFFMIGGDSIKAIRIASGMAKAGYKVEIKDMLRYPLISQLGPKVSKLKRTADQSMVTGVVPLTPIQEEFFQKPKKEPYHYNQAVLLYWEGRLDEAVIKAVFTRLQQHHDALRMTFTKVNGKIIQTNHPLDYPVSLQVYNLQHRENTKALLEAKANHIQASINLAKGPLMKLGLFRLEDGDRLLIVIHHLVIDGVSWRILFEDLGQLYQRHQENKPFQLPLKTDPFKYWSEKLSEYAHSPTLLKEITYWTQLESIKIPKIKKDFEGDRTTRNQETFSFQLEKKETDLLLTKVNHAFGMEINDILLTALGLGIRKTFGNQKVLIALEGHGREEILEHVDINRTIGWFTTIYPLVLDISYENDLSRQIREVKESLHQVPAKGIGFGILKYLTPEKYKKELRFHLKPQVAFNYLGQFDVELAHLPFRVATESAGNSRSLEDPDEYDFNISGILTDKQLVISFTFDSNQYSPWTVDTLIKHYKTALSEIISFCSARHINRHTPSDFTYKKLSIDTLDTITANMGGAIEDIYPLSPMQEGMLFHSLYDRDTPNLESSAYFEQLSYRFHGELEVQWVEKSLNELVKRHDILRTAFVHEGLDGLFQIVLKDRQVDFCYKDISEIAASGQEDKEPVIKAFKENDQKRGFDLSRDMLMRVSILETGKQEYQLIWSFHHILMDGWCIGILNREFFEIYTGHLENRPPQLPMVQPYKVYIKWLEKQDREVSRHYWQDYLHSYEEAAGIPRLKAFQGGKKGYKYEQVPASLQEAITHALHGLTVKNHVTLNTILQAVWGIMLGRYNRKQDVVFGAVVSGRPPGIDGVESMIGLFINTIPVRIRWEENKTFSHLLKQIQEDAGASEPHHYYPLADIQSKSQLKQNLLDHIFVFENYPVPTQVKAMGNKRAQSHNNPKWELTNVEVIEQTNYDFNVLMMPGDQITIQFEYNGNVYDRDFVVRIIKHFNRLIGQIIENDQLTIDELTLLSEEEKQEILFNFNDTGRNYPKDKTIHQWFEEQSSRTPDQIALVGNWQLAVGKKRDVGTRFIASVSYRELNKKSHQLACMLIEKGIKPDTVVCIKMERCIEMITGILAILKAGGAYLPIDPDYPEDRIDFMIKDSKAKILLTGREIAFTGRTQGSPLRSPGTWCDGDRVGECRGEPRVRPFHLVYIIYTSGSTGTPKGVMLEHRNLVNLLSYQYEYTIIDFSRVLQFATISFDVSFQEIFSTLITGGKLFLIDKEMQRDIPRLFKIIEKNDIKTLFLPTSYLKFVLSEENYISLMPGSIDHIVTAGEQLLITDEFRKYLRVNKVYLHNHYGPTETHVVTTLTLEPAGELPELPSIGCPISNTAIYIMDKNDQLQAVGVPGELYIAGIAVGRGYLNNPELSAEKFIFATKTQRHKEVYFPLCLGVLVAKIYRTGDLARWLPDRTIEFLGRIDFQVKIRGFRVELGEIESRLLNHEDIKEAVVVVKEDKYLCAYIVSDKEFTQSAPGLKEFLSKHLPDYMIPTYFIQLERIPLTPNNKIDRKALPAPEITPVPGYEAPGDEIEKKLAQIWKKILLFPSSIGIHDNFFELGGHSLKATVLAAKIHKELNVKIPLTKIFEAPTIRRLSEYIKGAEKQRFTSLEPVEKKDYYVLSSAQKRLYILQQMDVENVVYNLPTIMTLEGKLDRNKLQVVSRELVHRHESLRTSFHMRENQPVQQVHHEVQFEIEYYEATEDTKGENYKSQITNYKQIPNHKSQITNKKEAGTHHSSKNRIIHHSFVRPFDLSRAPLVRIGLIQLEKNKQILMIDMHHIISDGVSMGVLIKDFIALYQEKPLPPLPIQYKDYSQWQNSAKERDSVKKQETFRLGQFPDEIPVLNLPIDYPRPVEQGFEGHSISFDLDRKETRLLNQCARQEGATLFMVLLGVYNILLSKLSGQEDIVIGTPIAGRRHADLEKIIGMFVNTLALRNFPSGEKTFKELLKEIKHRTLNAFENQEYPFEDLVDNLVTNRDTSRNPLFDVMFALQNLEGTDEKNLELKVKPYEHQRTTAKFDLELNIGEKGDDLFPGFEYSTKLFKKETIERFIVYFKTVISFIVKDTNIKLWQIGIISEEEKSQIIYEFNDTGTSCPKDRTIYELFEEQVEKTPDHIALVGKEEGGKGRRVEGKKENISITYNRLNEKSNQLAYLLRKKGVKADTIVGIMVERSIEMIVGIPGILKAGGAYLPIDPDYPEERKRYMLKDSGVNILLTSHEVAAFSSPQASKNRPKGTPIHPSTLLPFYPSNPLNLAYIIYTSGSTGRPKGVMVGHQNVTRLVKNSNFINLHQNQRLLMTGAIVFDITTFEIWGALLNGLSLYLVKQEVVLEVKKLRDEVLKNKISVLHLIPQLFNQVMDQFPETFAQLEYFLVGGDWVQPGPINRLRNKYKHLKIIHAYGPTENTTFSTTFRVINHYHERIPIGTPISNSSVYILDRYHGLQPIGVVGELWVGGEGVARGYLNNPELTAEKFIFATKTQRHKEVYFSLCLGALVAKLYKTGDLARWLPDGNIEFLGRIDHQVKIRGVRIELGEIENQLLKYNEIKESIVLAREKQNGDKNLCAYIAAEPGRIDIDKLREYLAVRLPDYMIPSYFVCLEKVPLNSNGKIDRKALPEPEINGEAVVVVPGNETEKKLANIWSEVLGINKNAIGINDNFFQLGGHSLKATILTSKIDKEMNVSIPLGKIFKSPTIRGLAAYLDKTEETLIYAPIEPIEEKEYYPVSSAQKRMLILHQYKGDDISDNTSGVLQIEGKPDRKRFEETIRSLTRRHEAFRTSFEILNDRPVQRVHRSHEIDFHITYLKAKKSEIQQIIAQFIVPFDLSQPPLLRVGLVKVTPQKHILMFDMHHILSDAASMGIIFSEFIALYDGIELPTLNTRYKDFSIWQNKLLHTEAVRKQEKYWLEVFSDASHIPPLNMPVDFPRPAVQSFVGDYMEFQLSPGLTGKIQTFIKEKGVTLYMVLLTIYNILLFKYTGQEDIVVGTPIAGRRHADLENIIGFFVNTLAMRNFPQPGKTFREFLAEVSTNALKAYENQDYQFEDLVDRLGIPRDYSRSTLFDTMFAVQNAEAPRSVHYQDKKLKEEVRHLVFTPYKYNERITQFDIIIHAFDTTGANDAITFKLRYCTKLFKRETMEKFILHFKETAQIVMQNTHIHLKNIKISHDLLSTDKHIFPDDQGEFGF